MPTKLRSIISVAVALAAPICSANAPAVEDPAAAAIRHEIQQVLDNVGRLYRSNASGHEIADAFYAADATAVGEGESGPPVDRKGIEAYMIENTEAERSCVMTVVDRIRHSGNFASAYVAAHCPETKPAEHREARMFLVFKKEQKGWRVTQEMFIWGSF